MKFYEARMSFAQGITRAVPVFNSNEKDVPEPKRKNRTQRFDNTIRLLSRGITSSKLHPEDSVGSTSDNDELPIPLNPGVGSAVLSDTENPLPPEDSVAILIPVAPRVVVTLAEKKAQIIALANQNQWNQVLTICMEALAIHPQDLELMEIKGHAHAGLGQWSEALQCSNQILSVQNEHVNALSLQRISLTKRAEAYYSGKNWDQASADYEVLIRLSPDAEILKKLATCHAHLQRWDKALHCFKYLINNYGEQDISIWQQIGCCCLRRRQAQAIFLAGEAEFALEACKKLVSVSEYSQDPEVWLLGYLVAAQMRQASASQPSEQSAQ